MPKNMNGLNILHIAEGKGWAGIEAHIYNLLPPMCSHSDHVVKCVLFNEGELAKKLRNSGVTVFTFNRNLRFDFKVIRKLREFIVRERIDVIHMHGYLSVFYGSICSIGMRIKRIVTVHQPAEPIKNIKSFKFKQYLKLSYILARKQNTHFIAVSKDVRKSWIHIRKIDPGKMTVIHNGINLDQITVDDKKCNEIFLKNKIKGGTSIVSIIGRIEKVKGHQYFIDAAQKILLENSAVVFLIIGDGTLSQQLKEYVKKLKLENNIIFTGFINNIHDYLSVTDILVISSLYEGVPYTLLEAMAMGKAVVAANVGGLPEVIVNGKNGLLVKPENGVEIANNIKKILSNQEKLKIIGNNARETIETSYSSQAMIRQLNKVYHLNVG